MKLRICLVFATLICVTACKQVGSEEWCADLKETPKSEWTLQQAGDYTKFCVLHMDPKAFCEELEKKDRGDWTANEAADYAANCVINRDD